MPRCFRCAVSLKGEIADKWPLYDGEYERVKLTYRVKNFPIYKSKERKKGKWPFVYAKREPNGEMWWAMSLIVGGSGIIWSEVYQDEESFPKSPTMVREWMTYKNLVCDVTVTSSLQVQPEMEKPKELVWAGFGGIVRIYN